VRTSTLPSSPPSTRTVPVLDRLLADEVERSRPRLLARVGCG
jgi:hypothetical protein